MASSVFFLGAFWLLVFSFVGFCRFEINSYLSKKKKKKRKGIFQGPGMAGKGYVHHYPDITATTIFRVFSGTNQIIQFSSKMKHQFSNKIFFQ